MQFAKIIIPCLLVSCGALAVNAQSKFGLEISYAYLRTHNTGALAWYTNGYWGYEILAERDAYAHSTSVACWYAIHKNHILKLNVGQHQHGTAIDYRTFDDAGGSELRLNQHVPFAFHQITPAYQYRIWCNRLSFPIEIGLALNKLTYELEYAVPARKYNFDLQVSAGAQLQVVSPFTIGVNAVYMKNLSEYQGPGENGTYKPELFGWEITVGAAWE